MLFLRVHALLHFRLVSDTLGAEDSFPVFGSHLNMVFDGRGVAQFGFFGDGNEAFDVVPPAFEKRGIVRDGIVAVIGRGNTGNDGELAVFGALLQARLEVGERRGDG